MTFKLRRSARCEMEVYDFVADMIAEEESNNEHK